MISYFVVRPTTNYLLIFLFLFYFKKNREIVHKYHVSYTLRFLVFMKIMKLQGFLWQPSPKNREVPLVIREYLRE